MAIIRKATLPDMAGPIPTGLYTLAIKEAKYQKAATGSDMLVLDLQIVAPAQVEAEGKIVKTAGRTAKHRIVVTDKSDMWLKELEALNGAELPDEFDSEQVLKLLAEELSPSPENGLKYFVNVELRAEPYFELDPSTKKPVIGTDGQKVVRGYGFSKVSRGWPTPVGREAAMMA